MLKKRAPVDERVRAMQQKTFSEAYYIVLFGLVISFFYKQLVLGLPHSAFLTEFLLILISCFYVNIRNMILGVDLNPRNINYKRRLVVTCLVTGTFLTVLLGISRKTLYNGIGQAAVSLGLFFTTCTLSMLAASLIIWWIYQRRIDQLNQKLNEEEDEL